MSGHKVVRTVTFWISSSLIFRESDRIYRQVLDERLFRTAGGHSAPSSEFTEIIVGAKKSWATVQPAAALPGLANFSFAALTSDLNASCTLSAHC